MTTSVSPTARGMVQPSGQTPSCALHLPFIDRLPVVRCNARTLHVFRHGHEAAKIIREALSRAPVPYYPLAGRLKESSQGELQMACTGEGLWFVEASTDCSINAVNCFHDIPIAEHEKLLPDPPTVSPWPRPAGTDAGIYLLNWAIYVTFTPQLRLIIVLKPPSSHGLLSIRYTY